MLCLLVFYLHHALVHLHVFSGEKFWFKTNKSNLRDAPNKKNGIIWEFFSSVGPPPPLLGTPVSKKKSVVYFAF